MKYNILINMIPVENMKETLLTVPANLCFSGLVRKTSQSLFEYLNIREREVFQLVLVMDEIFMNAVQHGSNKESSVHIKYFFTEEQKLTVSISDEGTGEDCTAEELKKKVIKEVEQDRLEKTSGRGLAQIALHLTDKFEIEESAEGGITVSFLKNLPQNIS